MQVVVWVVLMILLGFLTACGSARRPAKGQTLAEANERSAGPQLVALTTDQEMLPGIENPAPEYVLGSEDVIEVSVWKNQDLSRTVAIRPDGKVSLPLIGDVQAAGLTTFQLRDSIKRHLKEYKETPEVSVIVREINSLSVFVMGEVVRPGKLQLRAETTLLQALTLSGGFTQYADSNQILLLRREGGHETRMRIRYKEIINGKNPEANVILERGDTIVVP